MLCIDLLFGGEMKTEKWPLKLNRQALESGLLDKTKRVKIRIMTGVRQTVEINYLGNTGNKQNEI